MKSGLEKGFLLPKLPLKLFPYVKRNRNVGLLVFRKCVSDVNIVTTFFLVSELIDNSANLFLCLPDFSFEMV